MSDRGDLQTPDDPELSAMYQLTRVAQPPAELDADILRQARRHSSHRKQRLLLPLATAALVLLGLSLTLQVLDLDKPLEKTLEESAEPSALKEDLDEQKLAPEARYTLDRDVQPMARPRAKPVESVKPKAARPVPRLH